MDALGLPTSFGGAQVQQAAHQQQAPAGNRGARGGKFAQGRRGTAAGHADQRQNKRPRTDSNGHGGNRAGPSRGFGRGGRGGVSTRGGGAPGGAGAGGGRGASGGYYTDSIFEDPWRDLVSSDDRPSNAADAASATKADRQPAAQPVEQVAALIRPA